MSEDKYREDNDMPHGWDMGDHVRTIESSVLGEVTLFLRAEGLMKQYQHLVRLASGDLKIVGTGIIKEWPEYGKD